MVSSVKCTWAFSSSIDRFESVFASFFCARAYGDCGTTLILRQCDIKSSWMKHAAPEAALRHCAALPSNHVKIRQAGLDHERSVARQAAFGQRIYCVLPQGMPTRFWIPLPCCRSAHLIHGCDTRAGKYIDEASIRIPQQQGAIAPWHDGGLLHDHRRTAEQRQYTVDLVDFKFKDCGAVGRSRCSACIETLDQMLRADRKGRAGKSDFGEIIGETDGGDAGELCIERDEALDVECDESDRGEFHRVDLLLKDSPA